MVEPWNELAGRILSGLAGVGAAYGTAKSGIGIANVGVFRPDLIMKVSHGLPISPHASITHARTHMGKLV
jgi:hypothetical protein